MLYPSNWIQEYGTTAGDDRFIFVSNFVTPEEEVSSYASFAISLDNMPQSVSLEGYLNDTINSSCMIQLSKTFKFFLPVQINLLLQACLHIPLRPVIETQSSDLNIC